MNSTITRGLRLAAFAATLTFATTRISAKEVNTPDHASELLARYGTLDVKGAGPYVEIGTFAVQVTAKLGRPAAMLPDGTWLYAGYHVEDSDARGTLVVHFSNGRVSGLSLVTPAVAMALMKSPVATGKMVAGSRR